jgi:CubicO group peptidase (beta-lactamase class C family)
MRQRHDHDPRDPQQEYDPSRLSTRLIASAAALVLAAVFAASVLVSSPEPLHSPLVGPLARPPARGWAAQAPPAAAGAEPGPATVTGRPAAVDELAAADPASQGLDPERLARGVERLRGQAGLRSLLVVRNGRVVADESFAGAGLNDRPHDVKSASKSLLSALVGIAIERGAIAGVDATVGDLLPGYARGLPEAKRAITLGDLLAMESGLASTSGEHYGAWVAHGDWTAAALARPLEGEPGAGYTYSTGNSHLVSAILTEATGRSTLELARETLLGPLGVEVSSWERAPEGYYFGGNSFEVTPRDLARFGQLYLQDGRWGDRQVVPAEWVERSTRRHAEGWPDRYGAYGYLWWLPPDDPWESFAAIGYGGQLLYVVPELEMLAVLTATHEGKGADWDRETFAILRDSVFGAALIGDG